MAVYTDRGRLAADTLEELHTFADKIHLRKSCEFACDDGYYTISQAKLQKAIDNGAKMVGTRELLRIGFEANHKSQLQAPHYNTIINTHFNLYGYEHDHARY